MPEPSDRGYTEAVVNAAVPVLQASRGRAFMLFTSHQALQNAAGLLPSFVDFPLFVQGSQPKAALLEAFKQAGNGVLLGTASFWEGVDVRGEALSLVVIDKLPFAPPDDPLLAARLARIASEGGNPFMDYQLPQAAIDLKQGAGRLIRSESDRGVLMICDRRLVDKPYGRRIWQALPPMRRTRELGDVVEFFEGLAGD